MIAEQEIRTAQTSPIENLISEPANIIAPPADDATRAAALVREGIAAAKVKDFAHARENLLAAVELDERHETALMWLASISDKPQDLLGFLQRVLAINPNNERAVQWTAATKTLLARNLIQQGAASHKEGMPEIAAQYFLQATEYEPDNETAWLWLVTATGEPEDKLAYLNRILSINPQHEKAVALFHKTKLQITRSLLKKGNAAMLDGDLATAREIVTDVMEYNPNLDEAWLLHGFLGETVGQKKASFERALELNPSNGTARRELDALHKAEADAAWTAAQIAAIEVAEREAAEAEKSKFEPPTVAKKVEANTPEVVAETLEMPDAPDFINRLDESTEAAHFVGERYVESVDINEADVAAELAEEATNDEPTQINFDAALIAPPMLVPQFDELPLAAQPTSDAAIAETAAPQHEIEASSTVAESHPVQTAEVPAAVESLPVEAQNVSTITESAPENLSEMPQMFTAHKEVIAAQHEETVVAQHEFIEAQQQHEVTAETHHEVAELQHETAAEAQYEVAEAHTEAAEAQIEAVEAQHENVAAIETATHHEAIAEPPQAVEPMAAAEVETVAANNNDETETLETIEACRFCSVENAAAAVRCDGCAAFIKLVSFDQLLANDLNDENLLREYIQRVQSHLAENGNSADEHFDLGLAYLNLRGVKKAVGSFEQVLLLDPNNVERNRQIGDLFAYLNDKMPGVIKQTNGSHSRKMILVVDDSPTVRKLIVGKLEKTGHRVVSAVDGMDALAKINEDVPDLILLDVTMPKLDGYQLCKMVKANQKTKHVPVVMISGKDGFFDKVRGRMAGSTAYITKPFGPETLIQTVETYLQ